MNTMALNQAKGDLNQHNGHKWKQNITESAAWSEWLSPWFYFIKF
jgi:hypothetical protein